MVGLVEYEGKQYIASVLKDGIGHPLSLETGEIDAGGYFFYKQLKPKPVTLEQIELWKKKYEEFHEMILEENGYDMCEEDANIQPLLEV